METCPNYALKLSKMIVFTKNWWTCHSLVCKQTCTDPSRDKRLARLISYIHHMSDHRHNSHVGNTAQHCRLGLFQDSEFAGDLLKEFCASSEDEHSFLCVGRVRNKFQFLTVQRNLKFVLWTLVFALTAPPSRSLGSGYGSVAFF